MAKKIPTLFGEADVNDMGFTLIHEHLIFWPIKEQFRKKAEDYLRDQLAQAQKNGIKTIVDVTPHRDVKWLQEMCAGFNINFILSTGHYTEHSFCFKEEFYGKSLEEEVERMEKEIVEGIDDTGVKAGVIKVAGNKNVLTPWEEKVFTAAAKVSTRTRTPICTHACEGQAAQQKVLFKGGANLEHVYYSHPEAKFGWEGRDVKQELLYYIDLVKEGSSLMFNNFDFYFDTPKDELMYLLKELAYRGYLNRILISIDMNFEIDDDGTIYPEASREHPETRKRNYAYIVEDVVPLLKSEGFTQDEIDAIFVRNPRRIFNYV